MTTKIAKTILHEIEVQPLRQWDLPAAGPLRRTLGASMRLHALVLLLLIPLISIGQSQPMTEAQRAELRKKADELRERNAREREEIQRSFSSASPISAASSTTVQPGQVCRATIAAVMGHDPTIVKISRTEDGVVYLVYVRPTDGTRWESRCRVSGNRVTWASLTGRWREDPRDERITFEVRSSGSLVIRQAFPDGSSSEKNYALAKM